MRRPCPFFSQIGALSTNFGGLLSATNKPLPFFSSRPWSHSTPSLLHSLRGLFLSRTESFALFLQSMLLCHLPWPVPRQHGQINASPVDIPRAPPFLHPKCRSAGQ